MASQVAAMRSLLLESPAWQAWCGGISQANAQTAMISLPAKHPTPHAILGISSDQSSTRDGVTVGPFIRRGNVRVYFASAVQAGHDETDACLDFLNHVDAVLSSLEQSPTRGGYGPVINSYALAAGPERIPDHMRDKYGDIYEIAFDFDLTVFP